MIQLIPPWAPNVHPMIVHFPIVLAVLAVAVDGLLVLRPRSRGLGGAAPALYAVGGVSAIWAYMSGRLAADTVFTPGMAHAIVDNHERWALATTALFVALGLVRSGSWYLLRRGEPTDESLPPRTEGRGRLLVFLGLGLVLVVMVQQTAAQGARLVYEQGVGVIPGP